jgi:hypothetical protein
MPRLFLTNRRAMRVAAVEREARARIRCCRFAQYAPPLCRLFVLLLFLSFVARNLNFLLFHTAPVLEVECSPKSEIIFLYRPPRPHPTHMHVCDIAHVFIFTHATRTHTHAHAYAHTHAHTRHTTRGGMVHNRVDRSGSMGGQPMVDSVRTLRLFLQSLPTSVTFNIVSFGSRYSSLFPKPAPMNNANLLVRHTHGTHDTTRHITRPTTRHDTTHDTRHDTHTTNNSTP